MEKEGWDSKDRMFLRRFEGGKEIEEEKERKQRNVNRVTHRNDTFTCTEKYILYEKKYTYCLCNYLPEFFK